MKTVEYVIKKMKIKEGVFTVGADGVKKRNEK